MRNIRILTGDCVERMRELHDGSVHCCVTSPPYWGLRDYGHDGQIGLEETPEVYVSRMVDVFREVRRVLRDDGTLWLNIGDSYASKPPGCDGVSGSSGLNGAKGDTKYRDTLTKSVGTKQSTIAPGLKPKDLVGIPWRVAFALQADGWWLRSDIIWHKPNPMPESVRDRPTKAHEYVFLLSKSDRYWYDADAISEAGDPASRRSERGHGTGASKRNALGEMARTTPVGRTCGLPESGRRNARSVWSILTEPFPGAHFATFPQKLAARCIKAGCPEGGTVLDPFGGAGTSGMVAAKLGRDAVLCEINPVYARMAEQRVVREFGMFANVDVSA